MRRLLYFALLMCTLPICAQQSAYQDADANTSIYFLAGGGNLTFNVSDSKFNAGYLHMPDGNPVSTDSIKETVKQKLIYGINFSGKPSTDLTNQIFQSGNSPATVGGGGVVGSHRLFSKTLEERANTLKESRKADPNAKDDTNFKDDWFLLNVNFTKSTFNTVPSSSTTVTSQHFNGFSILPTYNLALQFTGLNMVIGASGGVNRVNNADQLKKVSIDTTDSQNGSVAIVESKDAYLGAYAESFNVPIYSDFVFIPKHLEWLSFDAFERSNVLKTDQFAEGGFGIFIAQPDKATKVLGGISVAWKNGDRTIGIVGGWSF